MAPLSSSQDLMSSIDLHIGMPKAGSSAIQSWLGAFAVRNALTEQGITVCFARFTGQNECRIEPVGDGPVNSGGIISRYLAADGDDARLLLDRFLQQLESAAERWGHIVVSGESFWHPFWRGDLAFLTALDELGKRVEVRVGGYLRPQHTYLEAAWRQWGFRTDMRPSGFVRHRLQQLYFDQTVELVDAQLAHTEVAWRPFRTDLLTGSDVVIDYATEVLGVEMSGGGGDGSGVWANRGLPLDVINLLATLPDGVMWSTPHDNRRLDELRELLAEVEFTDSEDAVESRRVLHAFAHQEFEAGNKDLIARLAWPADHFVPPPPRDVVGELERLNRLWRPSASTPERQLVSTLLAHIFASDVAD